jgi:hypothetical protein
VNAGPKPRALSILLTWGAAPSGFFGALDLSTQLIHLFRPIVGKLQAAALGVLKALDLRLLVENDGIPGRTRSAYDF